MKIHHIGYLVKKIEVSKEEFMTLGYEMLQDVVHDSYRDADICFLKQDGYVVELVSPCSKESVVYSLMERYKNAPYHICYETESFDKDLSELEQKGYMIIAESMPAPALESRRVAFLINPFIGIIELLDGGNPWTA